MAGSEVEELCRKGNEAIHSGDTLTALSYFEKALSLENSPVLNSCFAFCIAKERGLVAKALTLCDEAIRAEPSQSIHYLNLGRVYLLCKKRSEAVDTFRKGLGYEMNQDIINELDNLGIRKPPVIPFLARNNPINKYLGILFKKLGIR
jgi:tetratricopeptide (TPR) repeat protein